MKTPKTRHDVVELIKKYNKYNDFINGWGRTPEEYFEEYSYKEPEIWSWILADLGII